ncbi:Fic/DOC family N-terminal domain-containing protein [Wolbachia endosymbiont of Mansonella ozzardi]|uniref:Fic/DOC family N-terminal domain-containing protein n=1 Tax=Wolbachia endosymbiont of Mansonella ozzardi TaxID=137464 RepID=UPI001CE05419
MAREAVLSSRIEGTQATLGESFGSRKAGANVDRNPDDLQEVHNYISALDYGLKRLQSFPLLLQLIKKFTESLYKV